jgi:hypothetical protein
LIYVIDPHPWDQNSPYASVTADKNKKFTQFEGTLQPTSYNERVALAQKMINETGIELPVVVDGMDNNVWLTYGPLPNCSYLIDCDGKVLARETWFNRNPGYMETAIKAAVPLPSAIILFGASLCRLAIYRRRKMNS